MAPHSNNIADRLVRRSLEGGIPLFIFIIEVISGLVEGDRLLPPPL